MESRFGVTPDQWQVAKEEVAAILAGRAREQRPIPYSELVAEMQTLRLEPHDFALAHLLGEISAEDHAAGRGMRSALVVFKDRQEPGSGFFALAQSLGEDVSDRTLFWVNELKRVYADWAAPGKTG